MPLCAACVWIFQWPSKKGVHHHSYQNLVKAAELGCKICISLQRLRKKRGLDEVAERTCPFTTYSFRAYDNGGSLPPGFEISILSTASWLRRQHTGDIHITALPPGPAPNWWQKFLDGTKQDLETEPWNVREDGMDASYPAGSTGDPKVMQLGLEWLETCRNGHVWCETMDETRQPDYYPTRLLDLGTSKNIILRLVTTKSDPPIPGERYATLSHCWGKNASFIRLTTENVASLHHNIPPECLPQSFTDAIITCRCLRIQYLWIDSLCILQEGPGSEQDWQSHVGEMHVIYSNCVVNLAIARASSPVEGAFVSRNPSFIKTTHVWAPAKLELHNPGDYLSKSEDSGEESDHTDESVVAYVADMNRIEVDDPAESGNEADWCLVTIFAEEEDFESALFKQPLWRRGWVFQERLMTPRMLIFGDDRIYWQCHKRRLNEYLPRGLPETGKGFDRHFQNVFNIPSTVLCRNAPRDLTRAEFINLHDYWYGLVDEYSMTNLTFPEKDKLPAISAIATRFDRVIPGRYCAGLFESDLPLGLLWDACYPVGTGTFERVDWLLEITLDHPRSPGYRAPTWSWASADGRTAFFSPTWGHGGHSWQASVRVLADVDTVSVELKDPQNPFGQVLSAEMVISTNLVPFSATVLETIEYRDYDEDHTARKLESSQELFGMCIMKEMRHQDLQGTSDHTFSMLYGIVLLQLSSDTYQRQGYFHIEGPPDNSHFPNENYERKTVKLV